MRLGKLSTPEFKCAVFITENACYSCPETHMGLPLYDEAVVRKGQDFTEWSDCFTHPSSSSPTSQPDWWLDVFLKPFGDNWVCVQPATNTPGTSSSGSTGTGTTSSGSSGPGSSASSDTTCIRYSEFNTSLHKICGGPYASAQECTSQGCSEPGAPPVVYCIQLSTYRPDMHEICAGPYYSQQQCGSGCKTSSSSSSSSSSISTTPDCIPVVTTVVMPDGSVALEFECPNSSSSSNSYVNPWIPSSTSCDPGTPPDTQGVFCDDGKRVGSVYFLPDLGACTWIPYLQMDGVCTSSSSSAVETCDGSVRYCLYTDFQISMIHLGATTKPPPCTYRNYCLPNQGCVNTCEDTRYGTPIARCIPNCCVSGYCVKDCKSLQYANCGVCGWIGGSWYIDPVAAQRSIDIACTLNCWECDPVSKNCNQIVHAPTQVVTKAISIGQSPFSVTCSDFNVDYYPNPVDCNFECGCCCVNGYPDASKGNQQECESCLICQETAPYQSGCCEGPLRTCQCPDGWTDNGTECERSTRVENCWQCGGQCSPGTGVVCGVWKPGQSCASGPCDRCQCDTLNFATKIIRIKFNKKTGENCDEGYYLCLELGDLKCEQDTRPGKSGWIMTKEFQINQNFCGDGEPNEYGFPPGTHCEYIKVYFKVSGDCDCSTGSGCDIEIDGFTTCKDYERDEFNCSETCSEPCPEVESVEWGTNPLSWDCHPTLGCQERCDDRGFHKSESDCDTNCKDIWQCTEGWEMYGGGPHPTGQKGSSGPFEADVRASCLKTFDCWQYFQPSCQGYYSENPQNAKQFPDFATCDYSCKQRYSCNTYSGCVNIGYQTQGDEDCTKCQKIAYECHPDWQCIEVWGDPTSFALGPNQFVYEGCEQHPNGCCQQHCLMKENCNWGGCNPDRYTVDPTPCSPNCVVVGYMCNSSTSSNPDDPKCEPVYSDPNNIDPYLTNNPYFFEDEGECNTRCVDRFECRSPYWWEWDPSPNGCYSLGINVDESLPTSCEGCEMRYECDSSGCKSSGFSISGYTREECLASCGTKCVNETFGISLPYMYGQCSSIPYGTKTITLPAGMQTPAIVTITGSADDEFLVNGAAVPKNTPFGPCNGSGQFDAYTFVLNSQSFTIAAGDNHGLFAGYDVNICFEPMPTGACLDPSSCACSMKTEQECLELERIWKGENVQCDQATAIDVSGCLLTVTLNYSDGYSYNEVDAEPVSNYLPFTNGNPYGPLAGWQKMIDIYIEDQNYENGGDIGVYLNFGLGQGCKTAIINQLIDIQQDSNKGTDECLNPQNYYPNYPEEGPSNCGCDDPAWLAQGYSCPTVTVNLNCGT